MGFIIKKCKECGDKKVFTSPLEASEGICKPCRLTLDKYKKV